MANPNSRFQRRYPPELRQRVVRMVHETIAETGEHVGDGRGHGVPGY